MWLSHRFAVWILQTYVVNRIIVLSEVRNNVCCEVAKSDCLLFVKPFVIGRKWRRCFVRHDLVSLPHCDSRIHFLSNCILILFTHYASTSIWIWILLVMDLCPPLVECTNRDPNNQWVRKFSPGVAKYTCYRSSIYYKRLPKLLDKTESCFIEGVRVKNQVKY